MLNKIVIAEDDDAIAHMVNMALGDGGYLCLRAKDGEEAVNMVRMHAPDLLVLDVMMPKLDGLEVARRLKADVILSKTPILMLTALGTVDNKVEGLEAGADDYMVKPFDLREMSARVKALIRASKREGDRNPTTLLPGSNAIDTHIEQVLQGDVMSVLHFDVNGFDVYADEVGFAKAEELVSELGKMVLDKARALVGPGAFVGHLGGVDFIAVTSNEDCEALAADVIGSFQTRVDGPASKLHMTVAVVTTEGVEAGASDTLAQRMAEAMRTAKQRHGSNYVVWKQND